MDTGERPLTRGQMFAASTVARFWDDLTSAQRAAALRAIANVPDDAPNNDPTVRAARDCVDYYLRIADAHAFASEMMQRAS